MKLDNHTPLFPVDLAEKDFGYILESSPSAPLAKATQEVLRLAIKHGYGGIISAHLLNYINSQIMF